MPLVKNKLYRTQLTDYTTDGSTVARIEGIAVFIPNGAVGDQCDVRITKVKSKIAFGRIERIVVPSRHRITPQCPVSSLCGGCSFQHISYEEELRAKEKKVFDVLTRIGKQDGTKLKGIVAAPSTTRYRNKAQYPVGRNKDGKIITGFYRIRSHDIVETEACLIQSDIADRIAGYVRAWMQAFGIQPYQEETNAGDIRHIYVRTGKKSGECQVTLIATRKNLNGLSALIAMLRENEPSITGILLNLNQRHDNVILGNRTQVLWGEEMLEDRLCGNVFQLSPHAFYQVNHAQTEALYAQALQYAALDAAQTAVDLYCGAGTITLALARQAKHVIGVEIVREAVENAKENAARNHVGNTEFICADAGQAASMLAERGLHPDVITVDPPRKGLDDMTIQAILQMRPQILVYISCDPATLARDIEKLCTSQYTLVEAKAFDLFPRTNHVETVVLMSKTEK